MVLDLAAPVGDLARSLIDIPSVSGDEKRIADASEHALQGLAHLTVMRDGDAIVARTDTGATERVIIAGHLDTVPIASNVPAVVKDDLLFGRGAVDMKAGVAVQLSLAAEVTHPRRDVTWVWYDHEEVESHKSGLGRLMRNHADLLQGDFAVVCEPTDGLIEGGCNGTMRVEITIPGITAHSARSWKGTNAIHASAPVLNVLRSYEARTASVEGLDYREGLLAVGIRGGIAGNVVPDSCVVTVNFRYAPDRTPEQAFAHITETFSDAVPPGTDISAVDHADACRPGLDSPGARELVDAVSRTGSPAPRAKLGWTDVARFGARGIPAVNYGPGDPELAHTDNEHVSISQIESVRKGLHAWLTT